MNIILKTICYDRIYKMPELPEVETVLRGLIAWLQNNRIEQVVIRQGLLRWPVPANLNIHVKNQRIIGVYRRAKYLLIQLQNGTIIIHLGMSGSLKIVQEKVAPGKHDHVDIILSSGQIIRYNDPRRFGAILWTEDSTNHPLLQSLGPEPLDSRFNAKYFHSISLRRKVAIKQLIMNGKIVTGIGNIYAAEALFQAKIHPLTPANTLTETQCAQLVQAIKQVLQAAIAQGGTTLKDFINTEGKPGYFSQQLQVYGRKGLPCRICQSRLQSLRLGQRSTVFCPCCQR